MSVSVAIFVRLQQLLQIMLPGVVEITQMTNGTKMATVVPGKFVTFYQYGDSEYGSQLFIFSCLFVQAFGDLCLYLCEI
jgi:hypothetical protein